MRRASVARQALFFRSPFLYIIRVSLTVERLSSVSHCILCNVDFPRPSLLSSGGAALLELCDLHEGMRVQWVFDGFKGSDLFGTVTKVGAFTASVLWDGLGERAISAFAVPRCLKADTVEQLLFDLPGAL